MSEKTYQEELARRLNEIQAQVLTGRIDREGADRQIRQAQAWLRARIACGRSRPANRFAIRVVLAGICFITLWYVTGSQSGMGPGPIAALWGGVLVTGFLMALFLNAEVRRLRAQFSGALGLSASRHILDGSLFDSEASSRDVAIAAIRVKNIATAAGRVTDDARASLVGALVDLIHAAAQAPFLFWPSGIDTFIILFEGEGPGPLDSAVRMATELLSRLAAAGSKLQEQGASVQLGIGLHHGAVTFGLVGSRPCQAFVVLGRALDHAVELADGAGWGEILVDETTLSSMGRPVATTPREPLRSVALDSIVRIHSIARSQGGGPE